MKLEQLNNMCASKNSQGLKEPFKLHTYVEPEPLLFFLRPEPPNYFRKLKDTLQSTSPYPEKKASDFLTGQICLPRAQASRSYYPRFFL